MAQPEILSKITREALHAQAVEAKASQGIIRRTFPFTKEKNLERRASRADKHAAKLVREFRTIKASHDATKFIADIALGSGLPSDPIPSALIDLLHQSPEQLFETYANYLDPLFDHTPESRVAATVLSIGRVMIGEAYAIILPISPTFKRKHTQLEEKPENNVALLYSILNLGNEIITPDQTKDILLESFTLPRLGNQKSVDIELTFQTAQAQKKNVPKDYEAIPYTTIKISRKSDFFNDLAGAINSGYYGNRPI